MARLQFGVLGALEVSVDGRAESIPAGRRRTALACLLMRLGSPVSSAALIEALWGEHSPQDPEAALRTVISRLRMHLGADAVLATPGGYLLNAEADALDATEFDNLLRAARATHDPHVVYTNVTRALSLWRGRAYAEHADAPFAAAEAARLEGLHKEAVEVWAAAAIKCGAAGSTVTALEDLLNAEPFRERAVELLMLALYRTGRQAEALRRFTIHRKALATELGLDPSPALVRMQQRILGHHLDPGPTAPSWLDTSTTLIGRDDDLRALLRAVLANRVCVLTGPGGVGKSRLAAEAIPPLQRRLGLPAAVAELGGLHPGQTTTALAEALGLRPQPEHAIERLLEALDTSPQLIILDECEHLLPELRSLVGQIAKHCQETRVLATSRQRLGVPAELVLPVAPLPGPDPSSPIAGQWETPAALLLIDRIHRLRPDFEASTSSAGQLAEICRWSDGLPLALEFAAARIAAVGVAESHRSLPGAPVGATSTPAAPASPPSLGSPAASPTFGSPDAVTAAIARSYELISAAQRKLLTLLAAFPGDFTLADVRGLLVAAGEQPGKAAADLAQLANISLVASRIENGESSYRLLRTVRTFATGRRTQEHEHARRAHAMWCLSSVSEVAAAWENDPGDLLTPRLEALSHDMSAALRWALDSEQIRLAAQIAGAVIRCLHWTPGPGLTGLIVEAARCSLSEPCAEVAGGIAAGAFFQAERGELARAREWGAAAVQWASDPTARATAWLALGVATLYSGDMAGARRCFRHLADGGEYRCEAHASLALIGCYTNDHRHAREHVRLALAHAPWISDASRAFAHYVAGEVALRNQPAEGERWLRHATQEADRIGAEQVQRVSRVALFAVLARGDQPRRALAIGPPLLADLRRRGTWPQTWTTLRVAAELLVRLDRGSEAALLLAAAAVAPSAPRPSGPDLDRYTGLAARLSSQLGPEVVQEIEVLAKATPRSRVVARAERILSDLQSPASGDTEPLFGPAPPTMTSTA